LTVSPSSRPDDARARRSRESLRRALLELVERKPFDQITVRDITREAHVSYPTFFRNYVSKAALLGDIGAEETSRLLARMIALVDRHDPAASGDAICEFVGAKRRLWKVLLGSEASFVMRERFIAEATQFARERPRITPELPLDLASSFVVSTIFDVLAWWLQQPEDFPVEKTSGYLQLLVLQQTIVPH
jgi:AcrR family transcriptional regulator